MGARSCLTGEIGSLGLKAENEGAHVQVHCVRWLRHTHIHRHTPTLACFLSSVAQYCEIRVNMIRDLSSNHTTSSSGLLFIEVTKTYWISRREFFGFIILGIGVVYLSLLLMGDSLSCSLKCLQRSPGGRYAPPAHMIGKPRVNRFIPRVTAFAHHLSISCASPSPSI